VQSFNYSGGGEDWQGAQLQAEQLPAEMRAAFDEFGMTLENVIETGLIIPIILGILGVLLILGLIWAVIRVAAQGGLIHLANQGLAGGDVRGMDGWGRGFHYWFRVFGVGLVLSLPFIVLLLLGLGAGMIALFATIAAAEAEAIGAAIGGAIGMLGVIALFALLMIPVAIVFGMVREVALRHVVIDDERVWDSIKLAWGELWGKRGVFGMWLVQLLLAIAFGLLTGMIFLVVLVAALLPIGFLVFAGGPVGWILLSVVGLLTIVALVLWSAAYAAFRSAAWTEFYRRMMGMAEEPAPATDDGMMAAATPA
jgi:hypothetical protein